jgi:hypothetical protein
MTTSEKLGSASGHRATRAIRFVAAGRMVSDHPDLWLPAALATMASIGWLPFVLAVVPFPSDGDLAFLASSVVLSPSYPLNVVLPAIVLVCVVLSATLLSATGEAVLLRTITGIQGFAADGSTDDDALHVWITRVVASIPALVAGGALLAMIAAVGPGEYQSPELGRGPLLLRIAADVWPFLVLEFAAIALGLAFAGSALSASIRTGASISGAVAAGFRDLRRHPVRRISQAAAIEAGLAAWLLVTWALIRLLWIPIGRHAQDGSLLTPVSLGLLVGFVAIWLCLVVAGGIVHAWSSAWLTEGRNAVARPSAANSDQPWS